MSASIDHYPKHLDWLRYISAFLLLLYASSKLLGKQFTVPADLALKPIGSLSGHQLVWYFYSYSRVYASLLGLLQLTGAALLLFRKTALLGAALLLPVMANIVLVNIFFFIAWGATCTSIFIFAAVVAILWRERQALFQLLWADQPTAAPEGRTLHRWIAAAVVVSASVLMAVGFWLDNSRP